MTTEPEQIEINIDERGRTHLGSFAEAGKYLATKTADGTVTLEPAVTMTKLEAAVLADPEIMRQIRASGEPGGTTTRRPVRRRA